MFAHLAGMYIQPKKEWHKVEEETHTIWGIYFPALIILAALPAGSAYIATTHLGWQIGDGAITRLTPESALPLSIAAYFAGLIAVYALGYGIHWMSRTYDVRPSMGTCVATAAFIMSPLMLAGMASLSASLWISVMAFMLAGAYSVYLLYIGIPIVMKIPFEQGFIYASAVVTIGLCVFVSLIAATVFFWVSGVGPVYVS